MPGAQALRGYQELAAEYDQWYPIEWPFRFLAPNLDLTAQFHHRFAPEAKWMLADGVALLAEDGLLGCVARLWSENGKLLATGTSKHMSRPNPHYEQELQRAREMGLIPAKA